MTIAVTGATGQLGSLTVQALLASQNPGSLVAVVRDRAKAAALADQGVQVRVASYEDPAALRTAFDGVDTLLLVSGSEVGKRIDQHRTVIDAARTAGAGRIVYTSAPFATTSTLVLAPEHKATEEYLTASGVEYTILRNNWYHENYRANLDTVRQTGVLVAAAGDGRVASASRRDFAEGAAAVLTGEGHTNKVYEFSGDTAWNYDDLAKALGEVAGRAVVYKPVDAAELTNVLTSSGLDAGTAGFVAALDTNIANGDLATVDPVLAALIGRPTTPLIDGLRN